MENEDLSGSKPLKLKKRDELDAAIPAVEEAPPPAERHYKAVEAESPLSSRNLLKLAPSLIFGLGIIVAAGASLVTISSRSTRITELTLEADNAGRALNSRAMEVGRWEDEIKSMKTGIISLHTRFRKEADNAATAKYSAETRDYASKLDQSKQRRESTFTTKMNALVKSYKTKGDDLRKSNDEMTRTLAALKQTMLGDIEYLRTHTRTQHPTSFPAP